MSDRGSERLTFRGRVEHRTGYLWETAGEGGWRNAPRPGPLDGAGHTAASSF